MKVRYIKEGYFKNPEQAKTAREKEKTLSNADKISGVYNDMYNSAKIRVLTRELIDYFTNYGNEYNSEEYWRNVSYCWYCSSCLLTSITFEDPRYKEAICTITSKAVR